MTYFAVIDTNVLVSALLASIKAKDTPPTQILAHILNKVIVPVYNDEIISEYSEVLRRKKFDFPEASVSSIIKALTTLGIESDRIASGDEGCSDPDDAVFYEVTLSVENSFLVTGNIKHFPLKPFVVTPAKMVEIIDDDIRKEKQ